MVMLHSVGRSIQRFVRVFDGCDSTTNCQEGLTDTNDVDLIDCTQPQQVRH
jgi:hypothetical protein